jgi:hypothetical protein
MLNDPFCFFFSASYEPSMLDIRMENPLRQTIAPAKLRGVFCYVKRSFLYFQRVLRAVHAGHKDREPAAANDRACQAEGRLQYHQPCHAQPQEHTHNTKLKRGPDPCTLYTDPDPAFSIKFCIRIRLQGLAPDPKARVKPQLQKMLKLSSILNKKIPLFLSEKI